MSTQPRRCRKKPKAKVSRDLSVSQDCKQSSQTQGKESDEGICAGCGQEEPTTRRYKQENRKTKWINCDICTEWWHADCACVPPEDINKIIKNKIWYSCAFCVQKQLKSNDEINTKVNTNSKTNKEEQIDINTTKSSKSQENQDHITIIDGVKVPLEYKDSGILKKEIQKAKPTVKITHAYSLSRGGFAVHTNSSEEQDKLLRKWPKESFNNSGEVIHVHNTNQQKRLILRNVDIKLSDKEVEDEISSQIDVKVEARRLKKRNSYKPMPIVLIKCENTGDQKCVFDAKLRIRQKEIKVEAYRNKRNIPTRCYRCQEYGHIASMCRNEIKCERCSGSHDFMECTIKQTRCANCKLSHLASSKDCPVFKTVLEKLSNRQ